MRNLSGSLKAVICLSLTGLTSLKGRHFFFFSFFPKIIYCLISDKWCKVILRDSKDIRDYNVVSYSERRANFKPISKEHHLCFI
jgi:hypothetical protein